jgi:peptidoglycan/LPS O-acetylase OafA/YrhL
MKQDRLQELDCLRGIAALAVVLFHYTTRYDDLFGYSQSPIISFPFGHYGVQLFFVISGFVIFMTLNRCKSTNDFVVSRFARLFPVYWFVVTVTYLTVVIFGLKGLDPYFLQYIINLTMLQGFVAVQDIDGVYWTLAWELQFYLFAYLVFYFGGQKHIVLFVAAWLGVQTVAGLIIWFGGYFPWKLQHLLLTPYCNLFGAGILFYLLKQGKESRLLYGLLALALGNQWLLHGVPSGIVTTAIFSVMLLFVTDNLKFIISKPLVYLGTISYSLYLIHGNIGWIFIREMMALGLGVHETILLAIVAALMLASFMTFYIEQPAMRVIKRFYKKKEDYNPLSPNS